MGGQNGRRRRFSIRSKLTGVLVLLVGVLVAVAGIEVTRGLGRIREVRRQTALVEASLGPHGLLSRLEDERNAAAVNLLGLEGAVELAVEDDAEARSETDAALDRLQAEIDRVGGTIADSHRPAFEGLDQLVGLRQEIDAYDGPRDLTSTEMMTPVFDSYTEAMGLVFGANRRVVEAIEDPDLRRGAEIADISTRQTDLIARLVSEMLRADIGGGHPPDGLDQPDEIATVAGLLVRLRANQADIELYAVGGYAPLTSRLLEADEVALLPHLVDDALVTGEVSLDDLLAAAAGDEAGSSGYVEFRDAVADHLRATARDEEAEAADRARWMVASTLGILALTLVATWLVARSITRPLADLARQATEMAQRRLPDSVRAVLATPVDEDVDMPRLGPIEVRSRDEVVDLAAALTTVQEVALRVATEQAVMRRNLADTCLNMGRRNQNLLERQIELITELERAELDPDSLAALFHLDHVATRMRRNAESLLVLAGVETSRRYEKPVPIGDVIRAAAGEVEDFTRVDPPHLAPVAVAGRAAADLSHMLAELIENALMFSPTDSTIEVRGSPRRDSYRLVIIDRGLGMDAAALRQANQRLAGTEAFTVAPSRYLGHYVAGHLAARHAVRLLIHQPTGRGLTTVVDLPPELLVAIPRPEVGGSRL